MAAALAVVPAKKGGEAVWKAMTGDILTINGSLYRRIKRREPTGKLTPTGRTAYRTVEVLEPYNMDLHVNPVTMAVGAGVAIAALAVGSYLLGIEPYVLTDEQRDALDAAIAEKEKQLLGLEEQRLDAEAHQENAKATVNFEVAWGWLLANGFIGTDETKWPRPPNYTYDEYIATWYISMPDPPGLAGFTEVAKEYFYLYVVPYVSMELQTIEDLRKLTEKELAALLRQRRAPIGVRNRERHGWFNFDPSIFG
jgi:hypothetical protein